MLANGYINVEGFVLEFGKLASAVVTHVVVLTCKPTPTQRFNVGNGDNVITCVGL